MFAHTGIKLFVLIGAIAIFFPTMARSEGLCTGLKIALREAGSEFVALRQDFDFTFGEYKARLSMGELRTCRITSNNVTSTIACFRRFDLTEDASDAESL